MRTLTTLLMLMGSASLFAVGCADYSASETAGSSADQWHSSGASGTDGTGADSSGAPWNGGGTGGVAPPPGLEPQVPDNAGDNYESVGTNPFVLTAADPFSTFAADVDTASYDIFRRDVGFGSLPQKDSVRLEEYVNYFSYDYPAPAPESEVPFQISMEAAPSPFTAGTEVLRVGIKGKQLPEVEKKPANLVFLIDTSGSMSSQYKLPLVKAVLNESLAVLDPSDTVSIVTYAGSTGVALPPTPVSDQQTITGKINSFQSGGGTNGAGGIQLAYDQAESAFIEGGINHVILCTDGDFNVGVSGTDALVSLIEEKRKTGITLTVLGFGTGNLNDHMMESITNAGNGSYAVIASDDQAIDYAHKRLLSGLNLIAKDLKIQVIFNPETVKAYRLLGYENRDIADEDFVNDQVDAGEVGAGHTVTALYEVVRTDGDIPMADTISPMAEETELDWENVDTAPGELVRVKVRYKHPSATEEDPARQVDTALLEADVRSTLASASDDFRWAAAVAAFAEILKESPYAAQDSLEAIDTIIVGWTGNDADREEFQALFQAARDLMGGQ